MRKIAFFVVAAMFACAPPKQGDDDTGMAADGVQSDADVAQDSANDGIIVPAQGHPVDGWSRPKGFAVLTFCIDDSANKTYKNGQLQWTGSFAWDKKTNTIKYASSWLPTDGPFIPLYDDGPMSKGGHEAKCGKPGDHKFCAETYLKADKDYTIEYGALDEHDHWIWVGPNGTVTSPRGSTDVYELPGLSLAAFGDIDYKVMLDTSKLHDQYKTITPKDYDVYVKTSANSWAPVQLLDNGKNGDDRAGDGVFTYQQSTHLGPHDGLCYKGQHVQFVFMFVMKGMDPDAGQEYKVDGNCAMEGVSAVTDAEKPGDFRPADVLMERDSRGRTFNTTLVVGGGKPWCKTDDDCFEGKCGQGGCTDMNQEKLTITGITPTQGPITGGTLVTIQGTGFQDGTGVNFGDTPAVNVEIKDAGHIQCKTPPHDAGRVDVTVKTPDGQSAVLTQAFEFTDENPMVTITDAVLDPPLDVETEQGVPTLDLNAKVKIENGDHTAIQAECGYGLQGSDPTKNTDWPFIPATYTRDENGYSHYTANLTINQPGKYAFTFRFKVGQKWVYADSTGLGDGFDAGKLGLITIPQPVTRPEITSVIPDHGPTTATTEVTIEGNHFQDGAVVIMGDTQITPSSITETAIRFTAPKHAMGMVDVTVKNPDGHTDTQTQGFVYVPKGTPTIDGTMDEGEWDPSWLVATNNIETDVANNELKKLYVAFDNTNLYVAIRGQSDGDHYLIGYLDVDYGDNTGYNNFTALDDNTGNGDLDDALSGIFIVDDAKFGADWGFGTIGMQSYVPDDSDAFSAFVGWRQFAERTNFYWKKGPLIAGTGVIEGAIPLRDLWGPEAARVPMRHHIALVVVITNKYGNERVNQALPGKHDADNPMHLDAVDLWIRPDNDR